MTDPESADGRESGRGDGPDPGDESGGDGGGAHPVDTEGPPDEEADGDDGRGDVGPRVPAEHATYVAENRAHWDDLAEHHPDTDAYDVEAFLAGESTLRRLERAELDVTGRDLLHLQCHLGLDTLSWVRDAGAARAVGVDFAPTAVETARELRDRAGMDPDRVRFVESDVRDLALEELFDRVVTTYGTVYWLPELESWAETVAAHLAPGGAFYVADAHPFVAPFGHESTADDLDLRFPYFNEAVQTFEEDGSYAGWNFGLEHRRKHGFSHPPGEIVTALADAGLRIEFWHDHPWSFFRAFEAMEERDGRWYLPGTEYDLPFTFSLKATLPG